MLFKYIAARKIQSQRKLLFEQNRPGESTGHWKSKFRDDIRRRILCFRKGLTGQADDSEKSDPGTSTGAPKAKKLSKTVKRKAV